MTRAGWAASLRLRLLAATVAGLAVALLLAGFVLTGLFRDHVMRQFQAALLQQLDQVTAQLAFDAAGAPQLDTTALTDPRWHRPYSGLYWQIDGAPPAAALRSRSLWDAALPATPDTLASGAVHVHEVRGPQDEPLLMLERTVHAADRPEARWRLAVAADASTVDAAVARFRGVLAASMGVLLLLLAVAAVAQVAVGLLPLRRLQRALAELRAGRAQRIEGRFPTEVQPLIDDFNAELARQAESVERARTQAGNLAHAVKTPLAVMAQAAQATITAAGPITGAPTAAGPATDAGAAALARLVHDQVDIARRHVDWHLARSRAASTHRSPGMRTPLDPVLQGLVRVMRRVHAERSLRIDCAPIHPSWAFGGEEQDLHEMLGNLLDNACKWARSVVRVSVAQHAGTPSTTSSPSLRITIEDDGPGIEPGHRDTVMARGARMDETVPGSGLGLAIVADLVRGYGGHIELGEAPLGGLRIELSLPAAA